VLALRPSHLRPRQAIGAVGASGRGRAAGADLSRVSARARMDRRTRPMRSVRRDAPVDPARRRGVPRVRSHGSRESGRLAPLEERRPYKAKVGGSSPSAPTDLLAGSRSQRPTRVPAVPLSVPLFFNRHPRSVLRSPRKAPHELDGLLEVVDARRRSWERRSDAAERPDGLLGDYPRIHVGRCRFAWADGLPEAVSLLTKPHEIHVGLRRTGLPREPTDLDRGAVTLGVELGLATDDAGCAQSRWGVNLSTCAARAQLGHLSHATDCTASVTSR
jgi:hypothetical protein